MAKGAFANKEDIVQEWRATIDTIRAAPLLVKSLTILVLSFPRVVVANMQWFIGTLDTIAQTSRRCLKKPLL